ncbi:hypothetical protein DEO23_01730 [Brachybacterium endophyticum]|uniref:Uncharacterized protein n=1 Tax=Brachybacterium endophyticum TaxID=2182385 RepID=A0A2U2RNE4_9MICO|nr:Gfo/Idh/MocA family oxidoreductase [Brachybacterium endophyticum]PWH07388.1 hypothetical protein DEO23_01730 [Brachybacterium endophyticum]
MKTIRVVIVGGGIRGRIFARTTQDHAGAEIAAICEPNPQRALELAAEFGAPVVDGIDDAIARGIEADAAVIATPDVAHRAPALAAIAAGWDILVEKPLAATSEDASMILEVARANGRRVVVGFENRWNPLFASVRSQLQNDGHRVISQRALLQDTVFVPTEMLRWAASSSPAWFLMPHSLDMAVWLSGARPIEVFARGVKRLLPSLGIDTYDRVSASFAMSDGSILDLDSGWVQPLGKPSVFEFRFEIETEGDAYVLDIDDTGARRTSAQSTRAFAPSDTDHRGRPQGAPVEMMRDFLDAEAGEDLDLPDGEQGVLITRAIEAVHRSLATGTVEPIPS